ncbi:hypothetical protein PG991_001560 [Apiospora marii]|uniref:Uncharacterized protein n=1 Tax=Apiospora marii TaxID=335849 RepID=A0ABR1SSC2_9PEZI
MSSCPHLDLECLAVEQALRKHSPAPEFEGGAIRMASHLIYRAYSIFFPHLDNDQRRTQRLRYLDYFKLSLAEVRARASDVFRRVAANELDDGFQSEIMSIYSSRDIHEEISIMKGVIQQQLEALTGLNHHHMDLWDRQLHGYLAHLSGLQEEARHIDELVSYCCP